MRLRATVRTVFALGVCLVVGTCVLYVTKSTAQNVKESQAEAGNNASPIYGITIPAGYRDWRLIAINQLVGAEGNDIAIKAFKDGKLPFPDGAIIAALHWNEISSEENDKVLGVGFPGAGLQSSVIGSAQNVQFMVKDSKKYAASGGWGYADFKDGKPGDEALHKTCFPCHQPVASRDYIFAHYAPTP
jgi:hypothetical protein